jgi:hypothetical protein
MVRPPPEVSSGSSVPCIASAKPRDSVRPSPTPRALSPSPSRLKAAKIRSRSAAGTPGPWSTTRRVTLPPRALAVSSGGDPLGEYRSAFAVTFATTRSKSGGSTMIFGSSGGMRTITPRACGPMPPRAPAMISSRMAGRENTGSAPACSRLTSSRVASRWLSWPSDSSAVASSSSWSSAVSWISVARRQLTAAFAAASGVRRSWLTAASSTVRIRSASATDLAISPPHPYPLFVGPGACWRRAHESLRYGPVMAVRPGRLSRPVRLGLCPRSRGTRRRVGGRVRSRRPAARPRCC